jgi:hypothetical protein
MTIAQIAPKNAVGRGVVSNSRCSSAVAASAASPAEIGTTAIAWSISRPFADRIGILSTPRMSKTPTTPIPAATSAVAIPPAHNRRLDTSCCRRSDCG